MCTPALTWPRSASRTQHPILGLRLRWTDATKQYRIERFPDDGDPVYCVSRWDADHFRPFHHSRKLTAAKKRCQQEARATR